MTILALEFSTEERSVALLNDNACEDSLPVSCAARSSPRTLNAFSLIEKVLEEAQIEREQVQCLAVGLGPGSYTGIRAAISIAQGWQLAREVRLLGISSVECLAAQAQTEGITGRANIIIDAQRNEFYLACYELQPEGCRVLEPLRLASFPEVAARAKAGERLLGPEVTRWFESGQMLFPDARRLAKLAAHRTDFVQGEALEPIYLRETNFVKAPPPRIFS